MKLPGAPGEGSLFEPLSELATMPRSSHPQRVAKSELEEARETKRAAAEKRADADRLADLTDAKKQERKDS